MFIFQICKYRSLKNAIVKLTDIPNYINKEAKFFPFLALCYKRDFYCLSKNDSNESLQKYFLWIYKMELFVFLADFKFLPFIL